MHRIARSHAQPARALEAQRELVRAPHVIDGRVRVVAGARRQVEADQIGFALLHALEFVRRARQERDRTGARGRAEREPLFEVLHAQMREFVPEHGGDRVLRSRERGQRARDGHEFARRGHRDRERDRAVEHESELRHALREAVEMRTADQPDEDRLQIARGPRMARAACAAAVEQSLAPRQHVGSECGASARRRKRGAAGIARDSTLPWIRCRRAHGDEQQHHASDGAQRACARHSRS